MQDTLEKHSFIKVDECKCAGTTKESWQHPELYGVLVEVKPFRGTFEVWYLKEYYSGGKDEFENVIRSIAVDKIMPSKRRGGEVPVKPFARKCCGQKKGSR